MFVLNVGLLYNQFKKPDLAKGIEERFTIQKKIDSLHTLQTLQYLQIERQKDIIDSITNLKRTPIYYKQKLNKKYEKEYIIFISSSDSVQLYLWTKSARK